MRATPATAAYLATNGRLFRVDVTTGKTWHLGRIGGWMKPAITGLAAVQD